MRLRAANAKDISQSKYVTIEDVDGYTEEQQKLFDDPMSVLEDMADVGNFKLKMRNLQIVASEMRAQGRETASLLTNWTFLGKPGTGKTSVARKMAALLHSFGLLPTSNLVQTSALDLTGEFVGQSKSKMQEKMDEARGGVLFIDEAYELGAGSYGNEVMTKLVQLLTDERYQVGVECALPLKTLAHSMFLSHANERCCCELLHASFAAQNGCHPGWLPRQNGGNVHQKYGPEEPLRRVAAVRGLDERGVEPIGRRQPEKKHAGVHLRRRSCCGARAHERI
jgi:hypothetical protein